MAASDDSIPAMRSRSGVLLGVVLLLLVAAAVLFFGAGLALVARRGTPGARHGATGLAAIRVPPGFVVEKVAGPELSSYPMLGTLDDRGRMFICESSGNNKVSNKDMMARPNFLVRMIEDSNGDGFFDRSTVFADKLTLPAGAEWYRGSLYVASPPDVFRFDDTNGDGVADRREVIATGWNLSSNAASLHGPFMGPDGFLYLTDGRHGFKIRTKEGTLLEGRASRIWRLRPDGSGIEWVAGGGFDNPVEVVFTPAGDIIGTMTYFTDPKNGERDALLHFVEGAVYPKPHPFAAEFKRTGDWMPVMTKFSRTAPAGLLRYRGTALGTQYKDNLFSVHFNSHRVLRHVLVRDGATFRTEDEDFLVSTDDDFHPTDVMEDADGSLLVVDTGAWFVHGCPISRISKPEIKGAIYRVRRKEAPPVSGSSLRMTDPRGLALKMDAMTPEQLTALLGDARPAVRDRATELLVQKGEAAAPALIRAGGAASVFALFRIGGPQALAGIRAALDDRDLDVRIAAARSLGMAKDTASVDRLIRMAQTGDPAARRQATAALGQIGDKRAAPALLATAPDAADRFVEHALIYSLITLADPVPLRAALRNRDAKVSKAALIALDQMDGGGLRATEATPLLASSSPELRAAALWVASRHPDWAKNVLGFLGARMSTTDESLREALLTFCGDAAVQRLIAESLAGPAERQQFLLDVMDRCSAKEFPAIWTAKLGELLDKDDAAVQLRAVQLIRARGLTMLDDRLARIAQDASASADARVAAIGALLPRQRQLAPATFDFLLRQLQSDTDAALRLAAAQALGRAALSEAQQVMLARDWLPKADPLIVPSLLDALQASNNAAVREALRPLLARMEQDKRERIERLRELEPLLTAGDGDVGRGRRIFFGQKVGCAKCHTIGAEGGTVGPDLTAVGAIRSGHDLLEAIVFPGATFVPGFEVQRVETGDAVYSGIITQRTPETVTLVSGPGDVMRLPRNKVVSMKPSTVSLMPDGLDRSLTQDEFRDLLAFLRGQKSREDALALRAE